MAKKKLKDAETEEVFSYKPKINKKSSQLLSNTNRIPMNSLARWEHDKEV